MNFQIGDTVIHWTHGIGRVVAIEDMQLNGIMGKYYVIEANIIRLWVPVDENGGSSIRYPTEAVEFPKYLDILRTPGQDLSDQHYQRKQDLHERMRRMTLDGVCRVIRDLADWARQHTLNIDDMTVLDRAREHLITEWMFSLGADRTAVTQELDELLKSGIEQPQATLTEQTT